MKIKTLDESIVRDIGHAFGNLWMFGGLPVVLRRIGR